MKALIALICFPFLMLSDSFAQSVKVDQTIKDAGSTLQTIGSIFSKKKKKDQPQNNTNDVAVNNSLSSNNGGNSPASTSSSTKAGSLSAKVKYIDADVINSFQYGVAVIQKGSSMALIDASGNFVVPYNQYSFSPYAANQWSYTVNGLYKVKEIKTGKSGYLNPKGKFFPIESVESELAYVGDGKWRYQPEGKSVYLADINFHLSPITLQYNQVCQTMALHFKNGLSVTNFCVDRLQPILYGYLNEHGKITIKQQYNYADDFYEGRAIVGKVNEFGELKYGFIDTTGKEIFPIVLSNKPMHFSCGFAYIEPKDKTEFDYGFINLDGKVAIKLHYQNAQITCGRLFKDGYANGARTNYVIDTTGRNITYDDFDEKFNITKGVKLIQDNIIDMGLPPEDQGYNSSIRTFVNRVGNDNNMGCVNLFTKKIIPAVFYWAGGIQYEGLMCFDNISHLAYAKMVVSRNKSGDVVYREGYINEDGEFVMVKGAPSKW